jgi:3-phosphoshikimate 1-carboxyvinyltransferase
LRSHPTAQINGRVRPPGDKSISHRALILGSQAVGETFIHGLLEGEDVLATAAALRAMGADIERDGNGVWHVHGLGVGGLLEPLDIVDAGNSGTAVRLLMGLVAGHGFPTVFTGDASLRSRPMARVTEPLSLMGAHFESREGGRLPITVVGSKQPLPITYELPVASAQVKSALLLAALNTPGRTTVIEPAPTRDHSEHLLRHFGADVEVEELDGGGRRISLAGQPELAPQTVRVPGDPSSAAFPAVAALIHPGARLTIEGVGLNPLRAALFQTLRDMGADIREDNSRVEQGERVADLEISGGPLHGIVVPPERAPAMIDEYPILAVAAACAEGTTVMRGIGELRVKESDRIAAMVAGLDALGVGVEEFDDGMAVTGAAGMPPANAGASIATMMDHRIAMSFLVYGSAATSPVSIDDGAMIDTSFPGFVEMMNGLGARIGPA